VRKIFGGRCGHLLEVIQIKQELLLMYQRNGGYLSPKDIAGIIWEIMADAVQYFSTYASPEDFAVDRQQGMP